MKHRIAMLAIAAAAILGAGAAGSAQAMTHGASPHIRSAQVTPATTSGPYDFQVAGTSNCIVTNGVGNQLTDSNTGYCADIKTTTDGLLGNFVIYQFTDGSGNCLRANNSNVVLIEGGPCNTRDTGEQWIQTYSGAPPNRFENVLQKKWLMVTGPSSGDKVWVGFGGKNDWYLNGS
jgi:hypothetical protein